MIRKLPNGKFVVMTKDGKRRLSKPTSEEKAKKRLAQIEFFKRAGRGSY